MTYHLTVKDVSEAALNAHAEGRLGYQRGHTDCLYRYPDGAVCAIGAALPDHVVEGFNSGVTVEDLAREHRITVDAEEIDFLSEIQSAHDALCEPDRGGDGYLLALLRRGAGEAS